MMIDEPEIVRTWGLCYASVVAEPVLIACFPSCLRLWSVLIGRHSRVLKESQESDCANSGCIVMVSPSFLQDSEWYQQSL